MQLDGISNLSPSKNAIVLEVRDDCDDIFGGSEQHRMQQDGDFKLIFECLWNLFSGVCYFRLGRN